MLGLDNPIHIAFLLILLLLVFGAKRLPEMGRSLGSGMRGFKDALSGDGLHGSLSAPQAPQAAAIPATQAVAPPAAIPARQAVAPSAAIPATQAVPPPSAQPVAVAVAAPVPTAPSAAHPPGEATPAPGVPGEGEPTPPVAA